MTFLVQEKTPPYLVGVYTLDAGFDAIATRQLDDALSLLARCSEADEWPGYSPDVVSLSPPAWVLRDGVAAEYSGDDALDPDFEEQLRVLAGMGA